MTKSSKTGIKVLGSVPWGTHICLLYDTRRALLNVVLHYIQAGLSSNEYCLWITTVPSRIKLNRKYFFSVTPEYLRITREKQVEMVAVNGKFDDTKIHRIVNRKYKQVISSGYEGLRVFIDLSTIEKKEWLAVTHSLNKDSELFTNHKIIPLCAYPIDKCGMKEYISLAGDDKYNLVVNKGKLSKLADTGSTLVKSSSDRIQQRYRTEIQKLKDELRETRQKYYKTMRASSAIVVITTVAQGKILEVNDNFCRVFGYKRKEVIGRTFLDLKFWPSLEYRQKILKKLLTESPNYNQKAVFPTKSGKKMNILYSGELTNIGGKECIITVMNDITDYYKAREKEQVILNAAMDGFWITDNKGNFIEVNDSYCRMIGYSRQELLKMSIFDVNAMESREETIRHKKDVMERSPQRFGSTHRRKDGTLIDIEISASYYDVGEGQFLVFVHDLSRSAEAKNNDDLYQQTFWRKNTTKLQDRFSKEGFQNFTDREIIELLLSLVMPSSQAKKSSEQCIKKFHTFNNFMKATPQDLIGVGVNPVCLFCIDMLHKLPIKVLQEKITRQSVYDSSRDIFVYLYYSMQDLQKEVFKGIFLNAQNQITEIVDLFEGTTDKIAIQTHEIIENAIARNTSALIFVHNHPSGNPTPTQEDKRFTRDLVFVGKILQIKVFDHIIIGHDRYYSFADEGLIKEYETDFLNLRLTGTMESRRRRTRRTEK